MNNQELKGAIAYDLEQFQSLDLDIIPSKTYYLANWKLARYVFFKLWGTVLISIILSALLDLKNMPFSEWDPYCIGVGLGACTGITGFILLMIQSSLNQYIIFCYQISPKLKTGEFLLDKIKHAGNLAYWIFLGVVVCAIPFGPVYVGIAEFVAFFVSGIVVGTLIDMEAKRIGISALHMAIKKYFEKEDISKIRYEK